MSENYSLNGYNCANETIYKALEKADLDTNKLKSIDKDSDGTISEEEYKTVEDELVSTDELEETDDDDEKNSDSNKTNSTGSKYSDNEQVASLQRKYDQTLRKIRREQNSIGNLTGLLGGAKAEATLYAKDSDARASADELVNNLQGQIESKQASIAQGFANLATINSNIQKVLSQTTNSSTTNTATTNAANTTGTETSSSSNVQTVSGSGKSLLSLEGDMSTCLDNITSSFASAGYQEDTKEEVADYIASVCSEAGNGYFDPKVIVSLIFSESGGDINASSDPNYVGFGQMSAVAVDEVNNQFGTNFTFADMSDPKKNIEALTYLLRFQYERYDHDLGKALTAYNVGNCESGVVNGYATTIMSRAGVS